MCVLPAAAKRVFWEEPKKATVKGCKLTYDGTPFFIKRLVILQCQHGKDKHAGRKKKQAKKRANAKEVETSLVCEWGDWNGKVLIGPGDVFCVPYCHVAMHWDSVGHIGVGFFCFTRLRS